jgi:hypothetical protein
MGHDTANQSRGRVKTPKGESGDESILVMASFGEMNRWIQPSENEFLYSLAWSQWPWTLSVCEIKNAPQFLAGRF